MVSRRGQLLHFEAHGFLDAAKSKPMPKDALSRLASMTKLIVSVAAVMMIERGDMKLHDPRLVKKLTRPSKQRFRRGGNSS